VVKARATSTGKCGFESRKWLRLTSLRRQLELGSDRGFPLQRDSVVEARITSESARARNLRDREFDDRLLREWRTGLETGSLQLRSDSSGN
jgi:hypothetical protein